MRAVAVVIVVGALAGGTVSITGASAAPHHKKKKAVSVDAALPTWSPDGKQIAFVHIPSKSRYRIVRTSGRPGGDVRTVLAARGYCCEQMQWAARGRILVNPNSRVKSVGVPGGKVKRLFFPSCPNSYGCQTVGFILSPDRKYAAVAITADYSDPHYSWGIGLVRLRRGQEPAVLSTTLDDGMDTALAFSPDSTQLVFSQASWDGWEAGPAALLAIPVDGSGGPLPLAQSGIPGASLVPSDVTQAQWSPDGRWVTYVEYDLTDGDQSLEVLPTAGPGNAA